MDHHVQSRSKVRVLITHHALDSRAGTQLFVRDVARELRERGHSPAVFSPIIGEVAQDLHLLTIPVLQDLDLLATAPDVIHGHHRIETMMALLRFPGVPAVYFCHDWYREMDCPPRFPRVQRFAAVDEACRDKLVYRNAIPEERIRLISNFVDLKTVKPRAPLPQKPTKALLLSNYAKENEYLAAVQRACSDEGISLDVVGAGVGRSTAAPERVLRDYELVFATGRSAIQAAATGSAVVLWVMRHAGPMVTAQNLDLAIAQNFGVRMMLEPLTPEEVRQTLRKEIRKYDSEDAAEVSSRVRGRLASEVVMSQIMHLYEEAIEEQRKSPADPVEEARAATRFVSDLAAVVRANSPEDIIPRVSRIPVIGEIARRLYRLYRVLHPPVWWRRPSR